jgi:uroporphyrinogen-III synthase
MAPQSRALPVLVTRPEPQASRFAEDLLAEFGTLVRPIISPVLAPVFPVPVLPAGPFGAVILTSETAVHAVHRLTAQGAPMPAKAFCVGDRTAEAARSAGFSAISAGADASALADLVIAHRSEGPFLHLRGRDTRGGLMERLHKAGVPADDCIVYAQDPVPLSDEAQSCLALPGRLVVPLFSPRTATLFFRGLESVPCVAELTIVAISPAVAAVCPEGLCHRVLTAQRPDAAGMMAVLARVVFNA